MKLHQVSQGSPEWLALRSDFFTASEAPAMMGVSKYQTRTELLALKHSGIAPEVNASTQRLFDNGHRTEAMARPLVETMIGEDLFPVVGSLGNLLASMDGMTIMGDTLFEHKALNQSLVAQVQAGGLEPHYYWQLEQQLYVSGASKVIFVCSDGTEENFVSMEYTPVAGRIEQLLAGWEQFKKDLAEFVPVAHVPDAIGKAPDELPALRIELTGMVTASNLKVFEDSALAVIGTVKTDLQTDQDFADAKKAVVWCGDVEKAVAEAKKQALSQTQSIDELFKSLDRISANARETRLKVDKMVKAQELSIKVDIKSKAEKALSDHIEVINKRLGSVCLPVIAADFAGAIKGKRNLASMRDAVDTELARCKIEANDKAELIDINLASLREIASDHTFLFRDRQELVLKPNADVIELAKARINEYEAEQKRVEDKRIADEAEAKRVADEAEAKRVADEAAAAEAKPAPTPEPVADASPVVEVIAVPQDVSAPATTTQRATPISTQAKPKRYVTVVIESPTEAVQLGIQVLGGRIAHAFEGDYSSAIEDAAA